MSDALVIAELSEDGKLKKSTLSAITFAKLALPTWAAASRSWFWGRTRQPLQQS